MRRMKVVIVLIILKTYVLPMAAQNNLPGRPKVGQPFPQVTLHKVEHFKDNSVDLASFRGQWLFLTFWSPVCPTSVTYLPKLNGLQQQLSGRAQFFLVGITNGSKNIRTMFEKLRKSQKLNQLPIAYDSVLNQHWDIKSIPEIFIIDPEGTLRYVTDGRDINAERVGMLLNGEEVSFYQKGQPRHEFNGTIDIKDKGVLHTSVLKNWDGEQQAAKVPAEFAMLSPEYQALGYRMTMVPLEWLYNTAYFGQNYLKSLYDPLYGKVYHYPVLELRDTSRFVYSYDFDFGKGLYSYYLQMPREKISAEQIMKCIREDLARAFPYEATIEERDIPVWYIRATKESERKLKAKGGPMFNSAHDRNYITGFTAKNTPINEVLLYICGYLNASQRTPFIDDTGIDYNVDVSIDADLTSLEQIKTALKSVGLKLEPGTKRMKVVVIRDQLP